MPEPKPKDILANNFLTSGVVTLDASGEVPIRIPLMSTFDLPNSNRGHFEVNIDDLRAMKDKFDKKIGFPTLDGGTGLPIDEDHSVVKGDNYSSKAMGWIKGLELEVDPNDATKGVLYSNPTEWTDEGEQAIKNGRFKMISPMGAFGRKNGKLSMFASHLDLKTKFSNIITGAGLTNEPFQSMMQPIRLSKGGQLTHDFDTVIYVYDQQQNKQELSSMTIDELRIKERDDLTVPELDFLTEHKSELVAEELSKFKLDEEVAGDEPADQLSAEEKQTLAAIKDGTKKVVDTAAETVEQERLTKLESTVDSYRKKDVQAVLDSHVKRGAIKQDQATLDGFWGKQLLAATTEDEQKVITDTLDALPENKQLAEEIGSGADIAAGSTAREQLDALAKKKVDEASKKGESLVYGDALKQVLKENAELKTLDAQEQKTKAGALNAVGA